MTTRGLQATQKCCGGEGFGIANRLVFRIEPLGEHYQIGIILITTPTLLQALSEKLDDTNSSLENAPYPVKAIESSRARVTTKAMVRKPSDLANLNFVRLRDKEQ